MSLCGGRCKWFNCESLFTYFAMQFAHKSLHVLPVSMWSAVRYISIRCINCSTSCYTRSSEKEKRRKEKKGENILANANGRRGLCVLCLRTNIKRDRKGNCKVVTLKQHQANSIASKPLLFPPLHAFRAAFHPRHLWDKPKEENSDARRAKEKERDEPIEESKANGNKVSWLTCLYNFIPFAFYLLFYFLQISSGNEKGEREKREREREREREERESLEKEIRRKGR